MINLVVIGIVVAIAISYIVNNIKQALRIKRFFVTKSVIKVSEMVTFSIDELVKGIKKYRENKDKDFLIEYEDNQYIELSNDDTKENLRKKLENIQDLLIRKRYIDGSEKSVNDYVVNIMHDIWVDFAHNRKYEDVFWRQMYRKLNDGDISDSTFNAVYRNFYSIKKEITLFKL